MTNEAKTDGELIRNSRWRNFGTEAKSNIIKKLDKMGATPNMVTLASVLAVRAGAALAYRTNITDKSITKRMTALTLMTVGSLLDGIDGDLKRFQEKNGRYNEDEQWIDGGNVDSVADRDQENALSESQIYQAMHSGDTFDAVLARSALLLNGVPSLIRASYEGQGKVGSEDGIGTRAQRAALLVLATTFPEIRKPANLALIAATSITTVNRLAILLDQERPRPLSAKSRKQAAKRFGFMTGCTFRNMVSAINTLRVS